MSRVYGLAVTPNAVVVVGVHDPEKQGGKLTASVQALSVKDGEVMWRHDLPGLPSSWGLAVDRTGRTVVTMQDGKVLCFGSAPR